MHSIGFGSMMRRSVKVSVTVSCFHYWGRAHRVDGSVESVQVDEQVYSSTCKRRHAARVVLIGVNVINSNGVRAQLCHEGSIELALLRID